MATNPPTPRCVPVTQPFCLTDILDGTQDFRWRPRLDDWYSGVLDGNLLHIRQVGDVLEYRAENDLDKLLRCYFRLDDDLAAARADLRTADPCIATLAGEYPSLRVLRQPDPWECMVAYICSANNSVAGISKIVEKLAKQLGQPVELDCEKRYTFPTPCKVVEAGEQKLAEMGLGLKRRPAYIVAAAKKVCSGELDLQCLAQPKTPYLEARRQLMECSGIGPKIADCIALFALNKSKAFPVDTWISRAIDTHFPDWAASADPPPPAPKGRRESRARLESKAKWARCRFGPNAGLAGQLLFRSQRKERPNPLPCCEDGRVRPA